MAAKHYYAMHTPCGNAVDENDTPIGTVVMFAGRRKRDEWVEDGYLNAYNGNARQTKAITEHDARGIMLRQRGREMYEAHERDRLRGSYADYREYAQYCPTAIMHDDYINLAGFVD